MTDDKNLQNDDLAISGLTDDGGGGASGSGAGGQQDGVSGLVVSNGSSVGGAPSNGGGASAGASGGAATSTTGSSATGSNTQADQSGDANATMVGGGGSLGAGSGMGFDFDEMDNGGGVAVQVKPKVPPLVAEKFPDLLDLINVTESMNQEEREYWLQILPVMTEDQIAKFRQILLTEKKQLQELDREYEEELTRLNEKHMIEWQEFESKEKRKALQSAEQKTEEEEAKLEEELLSKLAEI